MAGRAKKKPPAQEINRILLKDIPSGKLKLEGTSTSFDQAARTFPIESEAKKLEIQLYGQKQFLDLQKSYAKHIKWQLWTILIFQIAFVLFVGWNLGGFTDNINKLSGLYLGVIFETLANIIALGFVVSRFLFPVINPKGKD